MGLMNLFVEKYGKVVDGDYKGHDITTDLKRIILNSTFGDKFYFEKKDIEHVELLKDKSTDVKILVNLKDGKQFTIVLTVKGFDKIKKILF